MQTSDTSFEILGRDYLCKQVNDPKNPWKKAFEHLSKISTAARKTFELKLKTPEMGKCLIEEPIICNKARQSALYSVVAQSSLTFAELHPIFTFLRAKTKYPINDKKYQKDDERRVLTSRLAKLLKKIESGKMLTREQKQQKQQQRQLT